MLGKLIDGSGLCRLMIDSGLIAEGSLKGIIGGTHFNRCKRVHPIAALAFRIMHFNQFTKYYEQLNHAQKLSLEEVVDNLRYENETHNTENAKFQLKDIFDHYNSYSEKTRNGEHGFTAQYLMT